VPDDSYRHNEKGVHHNDTYISLMYTYNSFFTESLPSKWASPRNVWVI